MEEPRGFPALNATAQNGDPACLLIILQFSFSGQGEMKRSEVEKTTVNVTGIIT